MRNAFFDPFPAPLYACAPRFLDSLNELLDNLLQVLFVLQLGVIRTINVNAELPPSPERGQIQRAKRDNVGKRIPW